MPSQPSYQLTDMPSQIKKSKQKTGCGCSCLPRMIIFLAIGYLGFLLLHDPSAAKDLLNIQKHWDNGKSFVISLIAPESNQTPSRPSPFPDFSSPNPSTAPKFNATPVAKPSPIATNVTPTQAPAPQTPWSRKAIRGIYISRYQITNNATEEMIRNRVRYYQSQGFNTIIHGVWGNGCTMYRSAVMKKALGFESCPNQFQDQWLTWLIDEAHQQKMQVHAYFEKGIKIDKNSPIYQMAIAKKWLVPGVDRTYQGIDHYVLDVKIPAVSQFFKAIAVEFVQKYPQIDAVQWDDYLGYHAELPGMEDRTDHLTKFLKGMIKEIKRANSKVSFDLCHHNPYWAKRYFAADWENWGVDRAFIQVYNDKNFADELNYARQYHGVALMDNQLHRLSALVKDSDIKGILVFPSRGNPEETAKAVSQALR
jgi:uncharacterized lipoprotein YddW (UPF0748 family)